MKRLERLLYSLMILSMLAAPMLLAVDEKFLPPSDYYQGRSYFDTNGMKGYLDFAVYDTQDYLNWGLSAPDEDKDYVYAYQLVCDSSSTTAIEYFTLMGIGNHTGEDGDTITMGSTEDYFGGGLAPDEDGWSPDGDNLYGQAFWEFDDGVLIAGERSYYFLLSSDHDYTIGSYSLEAPGAGGGSTVPNPEPASLALLAFGGVLLRKRNRK